MGVNSFCSFRSCSGLSAGGSVALWDISLLLSCRCRSAIVISLDDLDHNYAVAGETRHEFADQTNNEPSGGHRPSFITLLKKASSFWSTSMKTAYCPKVMSAPCSELNLV